MRVILGYILLGAYFGIAAARVKNLYDGIARVALVLGILLLTAGCASSPDWRPIDTKREFAYQLVNAADAWQTSQIQHRRDVKEVGTMASAFMGSEPSNRDVALYFTSVAVSHYLISRVLPPKWRSWWQNTSLLYHSSVVYQNCEEFKLC